MMDYVLANFAFLISSNQKKNTLLESVTPQCCVGGQIYIFVDAVQLSRVKGLPHEVSNEVPHCQPCIDCPGTHGHDNHNSTWSIFLINGSVSSFPGSRTICR